jgi:site-specific DNA recombinase
MDKPINPNKVAIYIRWSTEDQSNGTTLETQLEGCKHYILSQGWNISDSLIFIDNGYSGGNLNRPEITKLRKQIDDNLIDCVVIFKIDRLSRSVVDTVNLVLDEWEGKAYIKSARELLDTSTPMGRQFLYILSSFAEFERSVIKERTFSGKTKRASEGKNSGFIYCFGYKKGINNQFKIVPEEAEIVKRIYNDYLQGRGSFGIAVDLNTNGIKNRNNKQWSGNTILYMLQNKAYIGILEYGRSIRNPSKNYKQKGEKSRLKNEQFSSVESQYIPSIITPEIFYAVQELKKSRSVKISKISGRALSSEHLLSGILKCKCGYSRFGLNIKKGERFAYYDCVGNKQRGKSFCNSGLIRKDILERDIMKEIRQDLDFSNEEKFNKIEKNYQKNYQNQLNNLKKSIKLLESNLLSLENQLIRIDIDYRNQTIDAKTHNRLYNQIETEKNSINIRLIELKDNLDNKKLNIINLDEIKSIPTILNQWDSLSIVQQKNLLRKIIDYIIVYKKPGIENPEIYTEIHYKQTISNLLP